MDEADYFNFPKDFLDKISNKIINEICKGINRVVYDITSKPPSTIEGNNVKKIKLLLLKKKKKIVCLTAYSKNIAKY